MPAGRRVAAGYTLIELLTVIAIVAILAGTAVPGLQRFSAGARLSEAGAALRGTLEIARSEAATRSVRVGVCRSANANELAPTCDAGMTAGFGGADWSAGWIMYAKTAPNVADQFEANDVLIRRQPALADGASGANRVMIWAPAAAPIVFDWNGMRAAGPVGTFAIDYGPPVATQPGSLHMDIARCLGVNVVGRLEARKSVAGACT
jgi:prepilin-type N-terminal cleavage/methylation domain-containing protein